LEQAARQTAPRAAIKSRVTDEPGSDAIITLRVA
jgi:hypothetical protein